MSQPKKSPTSLRIPDATRVRVERWATEHGMPRNAAYVQLIERGLKVAAKPVLDLPVGPRPYVPNLKRR